jgi:hypothetical protein
MSSTLIRKPGATEMTARAVTERREIAHRSSDGIEVTLFWSKPSNRVTIAVLDAVCDEALEFEVDGSAALDAFNHPYAYAAARRADAQSSIFCNHPRSQHGQPSSPQPASPSPRRGATPRRSDFAR